MASAKKKSSKLETPEKPQLDLIPTSNYNPYWHSSLFNEVYLLNDVPEKYRDLWEAAEAGPFYEFCNQFRNLCEELQGDDLDSWSERNTINRIIKPILRMLGYFDKCSAHQEPWAEDEPFTVKESGESKTYKPDLIIVNDPKELKYIERKKGDEKVAEASSSVIIPIEAKYWGRIESSKPNSSDDSKRADKKDVSDAARSLDFDEQCLKYMEVLNKSYGILTDGKTWRLYNRDLSSDNYRRHFQFNIGNLIKHVNAGLDRDSKDYETFLENAKYFFHIFSKQSVFSEKGDRPFVDDLLEYSKKYVAQVEDDIKSRFVSAMALACNGFQRAAKAERATVDLQVIRNVSESHLFNILFIRYCEARNILPMKQSPSYRKVSLSNTIDKLEYFNPEREEDNLNIPMLKRMFSKDFNYSHDGTELYERFLKLKRVVEEGSSNEFDNFEIMGFRESLFSKEEWAFVQKNKLTNREMVRILFELGYCESGVAGRRFQQIPYNFFSPRQLGSIYESFLEFRIDIAESDLIWKRGAWEKANLKSEKVKAQSVPKVKSGELFFTPDNKDRKATGSFYTPDFVVQDVVRRALDPICRDLKSADILKLRVCDPAMGSGHFLGAALNHLARKYLEKLECELNDDLQISLLDAKQEVLHKCIFGVDINPRAVKLAKMSLWLESASAGRRLEPLDDQLKVGDSLSLSKRFDWAREFEIDGKKKGFDAVVGNPPWGANIDAFRAEIDAKYGAVSKNHKEIYKLFVQVGNEALKSLGTLGFVLPAGVLYQPRSRDVREYLLANTTLKFAINLGDGIFGKEVVCPSAIVLAAKGSSTKFEFEFIDISQTDLKERERKLGLSSGEIVASAEVRDRADLEFAASAASINDQEFWQLEEVIKMKDSGINYQRVGVGLGEKGKSDLADRLLYEGKRESSKDIMYWKGEDINEYWIAKSTERWVRHNFKTIPKKGEVVRVATEIFKIQPKLVWRQTASMPIAAVDQQGIAFGRSIQCGLVNEGFSEDWYYLLALLLNSSFIRDIYKRMVMEEGRVFPQIKLAKLRALPVPKATAAELKEAKQIYTEAVAKRDEKSIKKAETFILEVVKRCNKTKKKAA